ncbi:MAG: PAS domain S-box protein, partial [Pedobacter sp.]
MPLSDTEYISILKTQYFEFEQLNKFFNLSGDFLCIAGFDGYFRRINPTVSQVLGYTQEELMARPINEFVFTDDKEDTQQSRAHVYQGKPLLGFENRYVTKSGEIVWLSWTSMDIASAKMVFAIAKNITHKKRLEEDRNLLLANMTGLNKKLKELTYTTSHDLRAPVNNLLSIFDLLDISKITDNETLQLIHILKSASESLKYTLNSYVD